jgi:hypothetical protein
MSDGSQNSAVLKKLQNVSIILKYGKRIVDSFLVSIAIIDDKNPVNIRQAVPPSNWQFAFVSVVRESYFPENGNC